MTGLAGLRHGIGFMLRLKGAFVIGVQYFHGLGTHVPDHPYTAFTSFPRSGCTSGFLAPLGHAHMAKRGPGNRLPENLVRLELVNQKFMVLA
jgi:hypothetical protein